MQRSLALPRHEKRNGSRPRSVAVSTPIPLFLRHRAIMYSTISPRERRRSWERNGARFRIAGSRCASCLILILMTEFPSKQLNLAGL